jgi:predicted membrane chloride channel (bestrophin family)
MTYLKYPYSGSFDNWFDVWCILLGSFTLIYTLIFLKPFLSWLIDYLFIKTRSKKNG